MSEKNKRKRLIVLRNCKGLLLLLLSAILFLSCSRKQKKDETNSNAVHELHFYVDSTRIEDTVKDTINGIQLNPPLDWKLITPEMLVKITAKFSEQQTDNVKFLPIFIFMNQEKECLLSVISIGLKSDSVLEMEAYCKLIEEKFKKEDIKKERFKNNNIVFTQYLILKENLVTFKLLFEGPKKNLIQIDYITSRNNYPSEVKSIESSIGSIRLISRTKTI
jgi:hypothetical protein